MKLHGIALDKELRKRRLAHDQRIEQKKTLRQRAKELKMSITDYINWETGRDVCPHKHYKTTLAGCHPPFILMTICTKCHYTKSITKINDEKDVNKYKKEIESVLAEMKRNK